MFQREIKYWAVFILSIFFAFYSCSPVKYIPENSYLLNKVDVVIEGKEEISKEEVNSYIRQKENLKILGFLKFHLWLYNLSSPKKDNSWLKRIGEEPVIYNEALTQRTNNQLNQYFRNKGYFNAQITNDLVLNQKKQKANINYLVTLGEPYIINDIAYVFNNPIFQKIFYEDESERLIKSEQIYDIDILDAERERIVNLFRSKGYYYFNKEIIYFEADSTNQSNRIDLRLRINNTQNLTESNNEPFRPYTIDKQNIYITTTSSSGFGSANMFNEYKIDSLNYGNTYIYSTKDYRYHPELISRTNKIISGELYNIDKVRETFNALNGLRQFRLIDFQFEQQGVLSQTGSLTSNLYLTPFTKQSVSFDVEGTNTSGNFGIAGNLSYQHRNLFHSAEIFRINLRGAMERQQAVVNDVSNDFNTRELGIESSLSIPKLLGPGRIIKSKTGELPHTILTLGYNYQKRPDYTRTITNLKFGYEWKHSEYLRHNWNIVDFNMVSLYKFNPEFINSIKDLYIKSSFKDHLILAANYSLVYNNQMVGVRDDYSYLRFTIESAGNVLGLFSKVTGQDKIEVIDTTGLANYSYYKIFDKRFAQYVKADLEFRYGHIIDKYNAVVGRMFLGIGIPYGNFDVLPFEKKYFTGGSNGIRAWQVRSLGPGSYKMESGTYPNQSSDIKLEANLEYRFKLIKLLEGALFLDAGNIWAINDKDNREGAKFNFRTFYKQIAIGTGTGFRFDFQYFIFRLDVGMKLRDPAQEPGNEWIIGNRKLQNSDFNLSFAIGYPF